MPVRTPIPFALQKGDARSQVSSLENVINFYPEITERSATDYALISTPGSKPFSFIPNVSGILETHVLNGVLYAFTNEALYRASNGGYAKLADHQLNGRVSVADNGLSLAYVDGVKGYGYTPESFTHVELDIPPSDTITFQDGYFAINYKKTRQWAVSNLNSLVFGPLDFASAEGAPDFLVAVVSHLRQMYLFGERTLEIWYNSAEEFPFTRIQGAFIEKGLAGSDAVTRTDNTIFFLGDDKIVYMLSGFEPMRVSNFSLEESIEMADLSNAKMFTYTQEGHIFVWLTVPTVNKSFVYDTTSGLWHERSTFSDDVFGRHLANCASYFQGQTIVGDYRDGNLYTLDLNYPYDGQQLIEREVTLPPIYAQGNRFRHGFFVLKAQNFSNDIVPIQTQTLGWTADSTCVTADSTIDYASGYQGSPDCSCDAIPDVSQEPKVGLSMTDNHGLTWTPYDWEPIAIRGKREIRTQWTKLGSSYERTYRLRLVAPFVQNWIGAQIA